MRTGRRATTPPRSCTTPPPRPSATITRPATCCSAILSVRYLKKEFLFFLHWPSKFPLVPHLIGRKSGREEFFNELLPLFRIAIARYGTLHFPGARCFIITFFSFFFETRTISWSSDNRRYVIRSVWRLKFFISLLQLFNSKRCALWWPLNCSCHKTLTMRRPGANWTADFF